MAFEIKNSPKELKEINHGSTMVNLNKISYNQINSDLFTNLLDDKMSKNCKNKILNKQIVASDVLFLISNAKKYNNLGLPESVEAVLSFISEIVLELCSKFEIENDKVNYWKVNVLSKITVRTIKSFIKNDIEVNSNNIITFILSQYSSFDDFKSPQNSEFEVSNKNIDFKFLKLEIINFISTEFYMQNNLLRNEPNDLMFIFNILEKKVMDNINIIIKDYKLRLDDTYLVYKSALWTACKLFKKCWQIEEKRVSDISISYPPNKIAKIKEKYSKSGGFPLEPIIFKFDEMFTAYLSILGKLDK